MVNAQITQLLSERQLMALKGLALAAALGFGALGFYDGGRKTGVRQGHDDMRVAIIRKVTDDYTKSPIVSDGAFPTTIEDAIKFGEVSALWRTRDYLLNTPEQIIEENK